jgi:hypothetical protein
MKLFEAVIHKCTLKPRVFVPVKPFQPSIIFQVRPEPTQIIHHSREGSWPYPQKFDGA